MNPESLYIRYGLFIAIALIAYFLILKLVGLHEVIWLRLFNGVIVAYGIFAVIRMRRVLEKDNFHYHNGFKTGVMTGFLATIAFVLFMATYMYHLDTHFAETIINTWIRDYNQGPGVLVFILLIEGFASTVVLTLAFMQKFKPSWNLKKTFQKA